MQAVTTKAFFFDGPDNVQMFVPSGTNIIVDNIENIALIHDYHVHISPTEYNIVNQVTYH